MTSRAERRRQAWWLIAAAVGVVVVLGLLTMLEASMTWTDWAAFVQAAIFLGTAIIVWRYTVETQRLRETAERQVAETQSQAGLMLVQAEISVKSAQLVGYTAFATFDRAPGDLRPIARVSEMMRELEELEQTFKALKQRPTTALTASSDPGRYSKQGHLEIVAPRADQGVVSAPRACGRPLPSPRCDRALTLQARISAAVGNEQLARLRVR